MIELVAFEADEDAGQDRPRLVARSRATDLLDRREERSRVDLLQAGRRAAGAAGSPRRCRRSAATRGLPDVTERTPSPSSYASVTDVVGQEPHEIGEEATRDDDARVAFDLARERRADRDLHVGRGEREPPLLGVQQDPSEHLHGAASRDSARRRRRARPRARLFGQVTRSAVSDTVSVFITEEKDS